MTRGTHVRLKGDRHYGVVSSINWTRRTALVRWEGTGWLSRERFSALVPTPARPTPGPVYALRFHCRGLRCR